jgi:hypothetical protein
VPHGTTAHAAVRCTLGRLPDPDEPLLTLDEVYRATFHFIH